MEPERGPGAYADSFARYITKQYGARGNTRALDLYIYALWGQHRPLHLISNDKSSAVVDYLNGFRLCDRWGKQEKRSQDGVPSSQRGDFTYMSLRLGSLGPLARPRPWRRSTSARSSGFGFRARLRPMPGCSKVGRRQRARRRPAGR